MKRNRTPRPATPVATELRRQVLEDFQAMRIPLLAEQLDAVLGRAESEGMSHLEFLRALISEQANGRRERALAHRIRAAGLAQTKTLADFDWQFNAEVIDRVRIETLAGAEFIGRRQNLVWVGQSGVGKSHLIQAIGLRACVLGYRVRYETSASVLQDLTAALADQTLQRLAAVLRQIRHGGPRRVRLRPRGTTGIAPGGEFVVQADQRPWRAIDRTGDEHRFRGMG